MPYSQFTTIRKAREAFNVVEVKQFLPALEGIVPSAILTGTLHSDLRLLIKS